MKAARFHASGGPEVLSFEDAPDPRLRDGEALVRVEACGVNRLDVWLRSGRYKTYTPHVLGTDVAGVVEKAPAGSPVGEGGKTLVYPVISDGSCPRCLSGRPNTCPNMGLLGAVADGGYAEYVGVPAANLLPLEGMDAPAAAALPVNFGTAWNALVSKARVSPEDTLLVWGAAGGVGHAAVQIARLFGATVIAAARGKERTGKLGGLGADHAVDYSVRDPVGAVMDVTGGAGATMVFDHMGSETWGKSIDSLANGGKLLALGTTTGADVRVDIGKVYRKELTIQGVYGMTRKDLLAVMAQARRGRLRPAVHMELPLASAADAHRMLESREVFGKLVLRP